MRQTSHKESSGPVAIMLFIVGVRYKEMRQASHKKSSGPGAIMLFILGVRQSSINMVFLRFFPSRWYGSTTSKLGQI